jgi:hypothetical protein
MPTRNSISTTPEFGEVQHVLRVGDELQTPRSDHDAGDEVADDRAEADEAGERHRNHSGGQIDEAGIQPGGRFHQAFGEVLERSGGERHLAGDAFRVVGDLRPGRVRREPLCVDVGMGADLGLAGLVRAVQHQRRQEAHSAQRSGLLVGRQERVEEVAVVAVRPVRVFRPPVVATSQRSLWRSALPSGPYAHPNASTSSTHSFISGGMLYQWIGCCQTTSRAAARAACSAATSIR